MFAAVVANFVVGSEILIGGAGVLAGMTGMSQIAAIWLLPTVIVVYGMFSHCSLAHMLIPVLTGGLRATFM